MDPAASGETTANPTGDDGAPGAPDDAPPTTSAPVRTSREPTAPGPLWRRRRFRRGAEWVLLLVLAAVVALVLRTWVVQSFYIPSTSMTPTLEVGDRVLVNKLAYRIGEPHRGDVVVFEAPPGEGTPEVKDLIKRIIGLPGERIEGRDGRIYIDGELLSEPWLPKGVQSKQFGPELVPDHRYWVLGDNRLGSRDSTYFKSIPRSSIIGKAFIRFWPVSHFGGL